MNVWQRGVAAGIGVMLLGSSVRAGLIYYDGQSASSTYANTTYDFHGLNYTMANGIRALQTSGGKRVTSGTGARDTLDLALAAGGPWDQAGFYDAGTGTVGGGAVDRTLYVSFLVRATQSVSESVEYKGDGTQGAFAAFLLGRSGGDVLGMGNGWDAWAYSIFGVVGGQDLVQASGGSTWLSYDRSVHLMVAKIVFHPNANDDVTVWLDPNPDDGDAQLDSVRRYAGTGVGDASFNQMSYVSGNIAGLDSWEFDEVRCGTNWSSVTPTREPLPIYYDAQRGFSSYSNTTFNSESLTYTMANGQPLPVGGGKRVTPGTGETEGTDTVDLSPSAGGLWDTNGLYDGESGMVGGGNVSGVLYVGCLVRAHNGAGPDTEKKMADEGNPPPPYGAYAGVQLARTGTVALGVGNGWDQWAYSIFGASGGTDLILGTGGSTWLNYDTSVHMLVAKITYQVGADDDVVVWLDPNPSNGDNQIDEVRRGSISGDMSFNRILYGSGNIPVLNGWDFDEVRVATDWRGVIASPPPVGTLISVD